MKYFCFPFAQNVIILLMCLNLVAGNPPPLSVFKPSPHEGRSSAQFGRADGIVRVAKTLYSNLGDRQGNVTLVADEYRGEFDQLNEITKGQLGDSLSALFAIRVLDLQTSILHTRKMQELLSSLLKK